jgi:hypothetical protein
MAGMEITIQFPEIEKQLTRIADSLELIAGDTEKVIATPGLSFIVTKQESEGDMLKMIGYAQLTATDPNAKVTERSLSIENTDGGEVLYEEKLPGSAVKSGEIKLAVGLSCHAELIDSDAAGNESDPGVADFVVSDVMKPPQPGMMGFVPTGQVDEP